MPDDFVEDASIDQPIPRGRFIGRGSDIDPIAEAEQFIKCEACGGWIDSRDLGAVTDHAGPLPHPAADKPQ
jgi:hypothetical protein